MNDVIDTTAYTIEREIEIAAPIGVVWRTITEPDQVCRWFSDAADLEVREGAAGTLTFGAGTAQPVVVNVAVVTADAPHRFSFRWIHPAGKMPGPDNSVLVTFTLTSQGVDRTRLRVAETGVEGLGWTHEERARYVDEHRLGWQTHTGRLRALFGEGGGASP